MKWKALYVASRSEKKVHERLTELGVMSYVPLKKEKRIWSDRKKTVITPMINGYVFVNVNEANRDVVFRAQGVIQYVRFNGGDAIIRDEEIKVLKSIEEKGYHIELSNGQDFAKGDQAMIQYGPFKGMKGTVENKSSENIYKIFIEGIGYSLSINVPEEVLIKG